MTSDTIREQLGEIVAVLINPISSQAFLDVDYRKLKDEAIDTLEALCQEIARETLKEPNELLRTMWQIAERYPDATYNGDGKTNWKSFKKNLRTELDREHRIMYPENYSSGGLTHKPEEDNT